jgi:hypothetical protein
MPQPHHPIDDRIRTWTLQRELVRASLVSHARGHVHAPARSRAGTPAPVSAARSRKRI